MSSRAKSVEAILATNRQLILSNVELCQSDLKDEFQKILQMNRETSDISVEIQDSDGTMSPSEYLSIRADVAALLKKNEELSMRVKSLELIMNLDRNVSNQKTTLQTSQQSVSTIQRCVREVCAFLGATTVALVCFVALIGVFLLVGYGVEYIVRKLSYLTITAWNA